MMGFNIVPSVNNPRTHERTTSPNLTHRYFENSAGDHTQPEASWPNEGEGVTNLLPRREWRRWVDGHAVVDAGGATGVRAQPDSYTSGQR